MTPNFSNHVHQPTPILRPARPQLSLFARRTADDRRAAAIARAAVLEVIG